MDILISKTVAQAVQAKTEHPNARYIAGGTDLLAQFHGGENKPEQLITINEIDELYGILIEGMDIEIGAMTTHTALERDGHIRRDLPALGQAAESIGAPGIRNMGTIGGNLVNASPAADLVPPLLVYDASVRLASPRGERVVPLQEFYTGYRTMDLAEDELLTAVLAPVPPHGAVSAFFKLGPRQAQAISKLSLAGYLEFKGNLVANARLAAGSVGPVAMRLKQAETILIGNPLDHEHIEKAAEAATKEITPIDDIRSKADYRRHALGRLLARFLTVAQQQSTA